MKTGIAVLWVLFTAFITWGVISTVRNRMRIKRESERIKVERSTKYVKWWIVISACWIVISAWNIYDYSKEIEKINSGYWDYAYRSVHGDGEDTAELRAELLEKPTGMKQWYTLVIFAWSCKLVLSVIELKIGSYAFITENGVYFSDVFIPAKKLRWRITDDHAQGRTLELFRGKSETPMQYRIISEEQQLAEMLGSAYRPHKKYNKELEIS